MKLSHTHLQSREHMTDPRPNDKTSTHQRQSDAPYSRQSNFERVLDPDLSNQRKNVSRGFAR